MKISIITPRYPPTNAGGGEISVKLLAEQLHEWEGVDQVDVFSFDGDQTESINGVPVRRLNDVPQYPYTVPNEIAYRKLKAVEPDCDVFHAYNMHLHPAVGRLSATLEIPAVATLNAYPLINWGEVNVNPSTKRRLYERTLLRLERPRLLSQMANIDTFLPLSSSVKRVYQSHGLESADYEVIPNMLDPSFETPDSENERTDEVELLYVGYLRDSKGVRYLVDAMEHLPERFELTVVGDGPKRPDLADRAAADRIDFTGSVPYEEVTQAYTDADVFVHPGVWPEPFGRTILEAMQAGLPVVATNIGGPAETVPQSELLATPGNPASLSESIEYAAANRDRIGRENQQLVEEQYHPDVVVPKFHEAYKNVLDD
ncbi:glycosyltransferase family 4 protein [Natrinema versiforme]|uniref:Group 1 glycosyl transferase n=1 Tax=Natrinema versiforme JCM 10478 TaxID=1227496 RepID=L9Y012_9EURY|nr:glycosyltransferase family 4 protein [Natrinema versiforme]ELY67444.1 group 1 glycosyl transferase [Natrinema versiforme JCM 10478]